MLTLPRGTGRHLGYTLVGILRMRCTFVDSNHMSFSLNKTVDRPMYLEISENQSLHKFLTCYAAKVQFLWTAALNKDA